MKKIRIPLEQFDREGFLDRTVEFLREWWSTELDPTYGIISVQGLGEDPVFGPQSGWDVLSALKEEGKKVFFPFAYTDGSNLECADRIEYRLFMVDVKYQHEMFIGLEDSIGYLVQIKDGTVIINSAIHIGGGCASPAPRIDLYPKCGFLEKPMECFIRGFMRSQEPNGGGALPSFVECAPPPRFPVRSGGARLT